MARQTYDDATKAAVMAALLAVRMLVTLQNYYTELDSQMRPMNPDVESSLTASSSFESLDD